MEIGSKEDLAARKLAKERTDPQFEWYYIKGEKALPCSKENADAMTFIALQKHPVDGHEFGLRVVTDEIGEGIPAHVREMLAGSITSYLYANPDGKPE